MASWLDERHPDYEALQRKRSLAWDFYTGSGVYDRLDDAAGGYLIRHKQGEFETAYKERRRIVDYTNHMATVVNGLAGMLFSVEEKAERDFGALGSVAEPDTVAARLWTDADGAGTNYAVLWRQLAPALITQQEYWIHVNGVQRNEDGQIIREARIDLVDPARVVNWIEEGGQVTQALVTEAVDPRVSVREKAERVTQYVLYGPDGWQRWRKTKGEGGQETETMIDEGAYEFFVTRARQRLTLPIFRVRLPLPLHVGYNIAMKAKAIFNLESSRDWLLWVANFPKLVMEDLEVPDTEFQAMLVQISNGLNALRGPWRYLESPTAAAELASEVLEKKIKDFQMMAMREYGDAARERTATEIRQDFRSGVEAFLTMFKAAMDEAEAGAFWRLEQIYYPNEPSKWGLARVERANDFFPEALGSGDRAAVADAYMRLGFTIKASLMLAGFTEADADRYLDLDREARRVPDVLEQ